MADTRVQLEVEEWVRSRWLPAQYGQSFRKRRVKLTSGGRFEFDAVSDDRRTVATISSAGGITAGGTRGAGKLMKIRADVLFLTLVTEPRRLVVLTQRDMYELCCREQQRGRFPQTISFVHAELPADLAACLALARESASREVSPKAAASVGKQHNYGVQPSAAPTAVHVTAPAWRRRG